MPERGHRRRAERRLRRLRRRRLLRRPSSRFFPSCSSFCLRCSSSRHAERCLLCMDASTITTTPAPTAVPEIPSTDPVPAHHASPVVAFIIGLAIVTLASILNAAGLNLTKLDHVSAVHNAVAERTDRAGR